jgi:N6-adenosine-specific RNA methylase IME4
MTINEILRMPLPPIADDAVLFLWRVSSMVEEAYRVLRAWDFVPKSEIVWNKTDETGEKDAMGMGRIVRGSHETCIVASRGKYIEPSSKRERTSFRAPRTEHSSKPEEFYRIVERLYPLELWPEAHVELFARRDRKGWIQFGDELTVPTVIAPIVAVVVAAGTPLSAPTTETSASGSCLLHGKFSGDHCSPCAVVATSVTLRRLLAHQGWRAVGWDGVTKLVKRDDAEAQASVVGDLVSPNDPNVPELAAALIRAGVAITSNDLLAMTVLQQSVAKHFVEHGGDPPDFLTPFLRRPASVESAT